MGRHLERKLAGPPALEEAGEIASEGRDGAIDRAAITYADRAHRHLGRIGWISAPAFLVSGSVYLSSQTSSMRQLLKMLLTMIVRPLTYGRSQVPPRR